MLDNRSTPTLPLAGGACLAAGAWLIIINLVVGWGGKPGVVGYGMAALLLLLGFVWMRTQTPPRVLPTLTTGIGILLALAPFVIRYREEPLAGAIANHVVVGLIIAAVGVLAGRRLRTAKPTSV